MIYVVCALSLNYLGLQSCIQKNVCFNARKHTFVSIVKISTARMLTDTACNCPFFSKQTAWIHSEVASVALQVLQMMQMYLVPHQMRIFRRTHAHACTFLHLIGIPFQSRNDLHLIVCQRLVPLIRRKKKYTPILHLCHCRPLSTVITDYNVCAVM